jgi:hypothetical protein
VALLPGSADLMRTPWADLYCHNMSFYVGKARVIGLFSNGFFLAKASPAVSCRNRGAYYESGGQEFESLRARQQFQYVTPAPPF